MLALIQRVRSAEVKVDGRIVGSISTGMLVYVGIGLHDNKDYPHRLADKVANLRIFEDSRGLMNLSVRDVHADILVVPNFTLMADSRSGRRPSFTPAAKPKVAEPIYDNFVTALRDLVPTVASGRFGEHMTIRSVADGPVNLLVEFPPAGATE